VERSEEGIMLHEMRLDKGPFEKIKSGVKNIEFRVNDEKRQQVRVGDEIVFSKRPELKEKLQVQVTKLEYFKSFAELLQKYPEQKGIEKRYSSEEEKMYGLVAIYFKKLFLDF